MWGGQNAKYMKAMMLPDYDYITDKDRSQVFDKKTWKTALGPTKSYDGWNFGYQCFNSIAEVQNPYTYPASSYKVSSFVTPVPSPDLLKQSIHANLAACLTACKKGLGVSENQNTLLTGAVNCCMFDPETKGCFAAPLTANLGYTGKGAAHMIFA